MRGLGTHDDGSDVNGSCSLQTSVTDDLGSDHGVAHRFLTGSFTHRADAWLAGPAKCVPLLGLFEGGQ
jgi:hypothetical protein